MRLILAIMFAVATIAPMSISADAAGKPKNKQCSGTALDNKKVSFKCKASEKCCFDAMAAKGTCVASTAVCL